MSDPVPLDIAGLLPSPGVYGRTLSGAGAGKILTAAELRAAAEVYSAAQADAAFQPVDADLTAIAALTTTAFGRSLLTQADATAARSTIGLGVSATPSFAGMTFTGPLTGTAGLIQQRSGLTAQTYEIFETFTSGTNYGSLCLKATASGHQIGSARGTSGSNRPVQLGHFNSAGAFTSGLSVATNGTISAGGQFVTGLGYGSSAFNFSIENARTFYRNDYLIQFTNSADVFGTIDTGFARSEAGVLQINSGTRDVLRDVLFRDIIMVPSASRTLTTNGQFSIEMTSNTAGNLVYRGSDSTTRRCALVFV